MSNAYFDLGAQGVIILTVEEAEDVERAIHRGKFPPMGRRSGGAGANGKVANDNLLTIIQIETTLGVKNLDSISRCSATSCSTDTRTRGGT